MSRQVKAQAKYCPVCAKAGMPEEVYSSHYVRETRDPSSRVTCPTIKFNKCGKCGKTGHFSSTCKVVERVAKPVTIKKEQKVQVTNRFAFSESDSESDGDESSAVDKVSDTEPEKMTKKRRIFKDEGMVDGWQKEFAHMFLLDENERSNGRAYWDKKHGKIVKKRYEIVYTEEGDFLRYNPSWASEDEYED
jgi:hypothetical protein